MSSSCFIFIRGWHGGIRFDLLVGAFFDAPGGRGEPSKACVGARRVGPVTYYSGFMYLSRLILAT